ncbi:origin recognition complex protein 6 [Artemisia annua]|uniref:Origin recognition complex protein 6 n=1 Tax=Artemisia annua TaxID=35608 RepID=A0A2U1PDI7_ARTAN|nr:origin recognition complex protein 6 [Artemisia annua]
MADEMHDTPLIGCFHELITTLLACFWVIGVNVVQVDGWDMWSLIFLLFIENIQRQVILTLHRKRRIVVTMQALLAFCCKQAYSSELFCEEHQALGLSALKVDKSKLIELSGSSEDEFSSLSAYKKRKRQENHKYEEWKSTVVESNKQNKEKVAVKKTKQAQLNFFKRVPGTEVGAT